MSTVLMYFRKMDLNVLNVSWNVVGLHCRLFSSGHVGGLIKADLGQI